MCDNGFNCRPFDSFWKDAVRTTPAERDCVAGSFWKGRCDTSHYCVLVYSSSVTSINCRSGTEYASSHAARHPVLLWLMHHAPGLLLKLLSSAQHDHALSQTLAISFDAVPLKLLCPLCLWQVNEKSINMVKRNSLSQSKHAQFCARQQVTERRRYWLRNRG